MKYLLKRIQVIGRCQQTVSYWSVTDAPPPSELGYLSVHPVTHPAAKHKASAETGCRDLLCSWKGVELGPRSAVESQLSSSNLLSRNNSNALNDITHILD